MTLTTQLNTEIARAKAAEQALSDRLAKLEAPAPPPPPPTTKYPPETKLVSRPVPATPPLPVLRQPVVIDGIRITRISDAGVRHAYAKTEPMNCDGSLLQLYYGQRLLDGTTYAPISGAPDAPDRAQWSPIDPAIMYGESGSKVIARNMRTSVTTTVHDFGRTITLGDGEGGISDNGIVAVQDPAGNLCSLDTASGATTPWFASGGVPDNCTMSRDGAWIIAVFETGNSWGVGHGIWAWHRDGSVGRQISMYGNHGDTAVDQAGKQVWVCVSPWARYVDIETSRQGAGDHSTNEVMLLDSPNAFVEGHVSGRAEHGYATFSTYQAPSTTLGSNTVYMARLDTSKTGRDFGIAPNVRGSDYLKEPHAVSLGDGRVLAALSWGTGSVYDFVVQA